MEIPIGIQRCPFRNPLGTERTFPGLQSIPQTDPDKVLEVLEKVKAELDGSMEQMTDEIKIFPVTGFEENGMTYTIQCKCKSYKHFAVQRAIRHEIYKAFKANKIKIPYKQVDVHNASSK